MEADTRKTAVKDAAGAAQRAKILDGRIFPSPELVVMLSILINLVFNKNVLFGHIFWIDG